MEYRLNFDTGEQTADYNLSASEREIALRYIGNKSKIRVVKDEFPNYMFKEDFNTLNQLRTLSPSQVILCDLGHPNRRMEFSTTLPVKCKTLLVSLFFKSNL